MDPNQRTIYSIIERFLKGNKKEERPIYLIEALGIKTKEVISLTGAGGKTTLMFRLAKELFLEGKKVVTTTTTKILEPTSGETPYLFIDSDEEKVRQFITSRLSGYGHITVAREKLESGKLKGISPALVNGLWSLKGIDMMIIEADGAAGRPIKAPREGEPVIPTNTTLVVAILGVDGIEKELNEENVFQAELISQITGIPVGKKMTEDAIAILMTHPKGIFKGAPSSSRVVAFLNKVDIPDGREKARRVAQKII
jgi:probable selenium-dependent hydroxylase accessory protein YqeC